MKKITLTAIIAGAMTLFAANAASAQDLRNRSYDVPSNLNNTPVNTHYTLNLGEKYQPRGGDIIGTLADLYERSGIGKRRADKLRLKREGIPDFETEGQAMAPRKAGKASTHFNLVKTDDYRIRLYAEAYLIRDNWTRARKPGFQVSIKINY